MAALWRLPPTQPGDDTQPLPLPSILDLSNKLHGCKFFSCIDLVKG